MAEDLSTLLRNFSLTGEESVEMRHIRWTGISLRGKSCLVGKLLADRIVGKDAVTPRLLQKGISENFDFHMTLRHHQSYKLAAEYIFFLTLTHQSF